MTYAELQVEFVKEHIGRVISKLQHEISGAEEDQAADAQISQHIRTLERVLEVL